MADGLSHFIGLLPALDALLASLAPVIMVLDGLVFYLGSRIALLSSLRTVLTGLRSSRRWYYVSADILIIGISGIGWFQVIESKGHEFKPQEDFSFVLFAEELFNLPSVAPDDHRGHQRISGLAGFFSRVADEPLEQGMVALGRGQLWQAEGHFKTLADTMTNNWYKRCTTIYLLGVAQLLKGETTMAIGTFQRSAGRDDIDCWSLYQLARIQLERSDSESAELYSDSILLISGEWNPTIVRFQRSIDSVINHESGLEPDDKKP